MNSMEYIPPSEADGLSSSQILHLSRNQKIQCHVHKNSPLDPILRYETSPHNYILFLQDPS
jgi:hypothetical protein